MRPCCWFRWVCLSRSSVVTRRECSLTSQSQHQMTQDSQVPIMLCSQFGIQPAQVFRYNCGAPFRAATRCQTSERRSRYTHGSATDMCHVLSSHQMEARRTMTSSTSRQMALAHAQLLHRKPQPAKRGQYTHTWLSRGIFPPPPNPSSLMVLSHVLEMSQQLIVHTGRNSRERNGTLCVNWESYGHPCVSRGGWLP